MAHPRCCCCGQLLPVKSRVAGFLKPSVLYTIYDFVSRHPEGVTRKQIFEHVYGHRPSGGPSVGLNIVNVHMCRMNELLAARDMMIKRAGAVYNLRRQSTGNIWLPRA
jgi:hypothetical protein